MVEMKATNSQHSVSNATIGECSTIHFNVKKKVMKNDNNKGTTGSTTAIFTTPLHGIRADMSVGVVSRLLHGIRVDMSVEAVSISQKCKELKEPPKMQCFASAV